MEQFRQLLKELESQRQGFYTSAGTLIILVDRKSQGKYQASIIEESFHMLFFEGKEINGIEGATKEGTIELLNIINKLDILKPYEINLPDEWIEYCSN